MNNILRTITAAITTAICVTFSSCDNEPIVLNQYFSNSETYVEYVSDEPIELSTFRMDSVKTSAQNLVWIGHHNKKIIGDVYSTSFVKLGEPVFLGPQSTSTDPYDWAPKEKYDSITIVLYHTGAYQGDTTKAMTIDVRRMAQPIRFAEKETEFYNVRSFRDSTSIGSFRFLPFPVSHPRLRYRLDDTFGRELVKFIKDNKPYDSKVRYQNFEKFLGGIKLVAGDDSENLLAFRADSVRINLHSHITELYKYKIIRTLSVNDLNLGLQFNHVWTENEDSPYDEIDHVSEQVREDKGGLHSVQFEGLGYYTRINFPTIKEIASKCRNKHVIKANLIIYPERDGYDRYNFPKTFFLSVVNRGNVILGNATDRYMKPIFSVLHDEGLGMNLYDRYYTIDITNYLNTIIVNNDIDPDEGLAMTWNVSKSATDYNFMIFNGFGKKKYYSHLELYYYDYDREDK